MKAEGVPEATRAMLATLWQKNLPIVRERVGELERAANAAVTASLSASDRSSAEGTAHKLAGSLGMFGYTHGTGLAREMEQMLEGTETFDAQRLTELARALRTELQL